MSRDSFWSNALGEMAPNCWHLQSIDGCDVRVIGLSRKGRAIYGLVTGNGPLRVSIVAGAHADEPAGPRAAVHLAANIAQRQHEWARELASAATFYIVPHVNPDGDADNALWQHARGDFATYLKNVVRESPGDDVEFNYPRDETDRDTRPENLAAADFFRSAGASFHLHASLHSMGVAEGAWFLVCREWVERARCGGMFERLANAAGLRGLALHDMDRSGEKGFTRIAPGFCTTPRSDAMRDFFLERNEPQTARLFRPSSMEFIQGLGGDPLCIVSEIPYFEMQAARHSNAPLNARPYHELRNALPIIRAELERGEDTQLKEAVNKYGITAVDWAVHMELQLIYIIEAVKLVRAS